MDACEHGFGGPCNRDIGLQLLRVLVLGGQAEAEALLGVLRILPRPSTRPTGLGALPGPAACDMTTSARGSCHASPPGGSDQILEVLRGVLAGDDDSGPGDSSGQANSKGRWAPVGPWAIPRLVTACTSIAEVRENMLEVISLVELLAGIVSRHGASACGSLDSLVSGLVDILSAAQR
eukprot:scaffold453451_cov46-Prasinocladus_malaysianus.AAC.1